MSSTEPASSASLDLHSDGTVTGTWTAAPPPPPPPSGRNAGATVDVVAGFYGTCSGGALDTCSAQAFDNAVSHGLATPIIPAMTMQKVYLAESSLPTSLPARWPPYVKNGGRLLISAKPSKTFSAAEDSAFQTFLRTLVNDLSTAAFHLVLWQEPNTSKSGFTAAQYHAYFAHYAPLVHAVDPSIVIVYNVAVCGPGDTCNETSGKDFYPGDQYVAGVGGDFYGTAYNAGGRLDVLASLADGHQPGSVPLYLPEWGPSAVGTYTFDLAKWTAYTDYLAGIATTRRQAGKANGWWLYWGSSSQGGAGTDLMAATGDAKVPGFQKVFTAVNG